MDVSDALSRLLEERPQERETEIPGTLSLEEFILRVKQSGVEYPWSALPGILREMNRRRAQQ